LRQTNVEQHETMDGDKLHEVSQLS